MLASPPRHRKLLALQHVWGGLFREEPVLVSSFHNHCRRQSRCHCFNRRHRAGRHRHDLQIFDAENGSFSISPLALAPNNGTIDYFVDFFDGGRIQVSSLGTGCFITGVNLPQGATMTGLTTFWSSVSGSRRFVIFIYKHARQQRRGERSSSRLEASWTVQTTRETVEGPSRRKAFKAIIQSSHVVVNNNQYAYSFAACLASAQQILRRQDQLHLHPRRGLTTGGTSKMNIGQQRRSAAVHRRGCTLSPFFCKGEIAMRGLALTLLTATGLALSFPGIAMAADAAVPAPRYAEPQYAEPQYAEPEYVERVEIARPVYVAPPPVYIAPPVYIGRPFYGPRRIYAAPYYGRPFVRHYAPPRHGWGYHRPWRRYAGR